MAISSGCAATSLVAYRVAPDYPKAERTSLELPGIEDPNGARIYSDALGIPHIEAATTNDLLCAVGYAQARDRFFEMDMMRRFAQGRVSALVGEQPLFSGTTIDFDRSMRGWELEERAKTIVAALPPVERGQLERYARCVNAAVAEHKPLEYRLLGVEPLPWTPEDTWTVGLLNAWSVSHNWQQELARFTFALSVGVDRSEAIYPPEPLEGTRTLPGDGKRRELPPSVVPEMRAYLESLHAPALRAPQLGSNDGSSVPMRTIAVRGLEDATCAVAHEPSAASATAPRGIDGSARGGAHERTAMPATAVRGADDSRCSGAQGRTVASATPAPDSVDATCDAARTLAAAFFGATSTGGTGGVSVLALAGASNAWVVAGTRSVSGKPVLANDPHLSHLLPSIVYQEHLKTPDLDVIGITIPGLPWVVMGHNERVAWGITSTVADAMDLVVEQPDPKRPGFVMHEGGDCPLTSREVVFEVKDGTPRTATLRRTCNGPILNDMMPELLPPGAPLVAVRWLSLGVEKSLSALEQIDRVHDVKELRDVVVDLASPIQTFTAADVDGHIATFMSGTVPLRPNARGTFPIPGWLSKYEWNGVAPREQLPAAFDPPSGFFANANNLMIDPRETDAPVNIDAAPPFRVDRIRQRLDAVAKHDADSMQDIQHDVKLLRAEKIVPRMLEELATFAPRDDTDREALDVLRKWNFEATADSAGAALFWTTYRNAVLTAVSDELDEAPRHFFMSQRYSTNVADGWFDRADHPVWSAPPVLDEHGTPVKEIDLVSDGVRLDARGSERGAVQGRSRGEVVRSAFAQAVDSLKQELGGAPVTWRWGKIHSVEPRHPFGGKAALAGLVNLEKTEAGGALDSIWKSHFEMGDEHHPFRAMAGPVYRMVIDLGDVKHARWAIDTGASGWPGSPHYGDQFALWREGKLAPMTFDMDEVKRDAQGETHLVPPKIVVIDAGK